MGLSQFEDFWHQPSSIARYLAALFFYNNLMLFAWAGFVSAIWTFVFDANESHLNMSERERDERARQRESVFLERVCVVIFWTGHQKHSRATRQLVLFASYLTQTRIHSVYTLTTPQHTQRKNHTNTANHSSIFYARMHHTSAPLCKLQLMCTREKKRGVS